MSIGFWIFTLTTILLLILAIKRLNHSQGNDSYTNPGDSSFSMDNTSVSSCNSGPDFSCDGGGDSGGGGD